MNFPVCAGAALVPVQVLPDKGSARTPVPLAARVLPSFEDRMRRALAVLSCAVLAVAAAGTTFGCSPDEDRGAAAERAIRDVSGESRGGADAARALLAEAEQAANAGRNTQSNDAFERALAIYQTEGDLSGQGDTLLGMGTLARYDGQGEVAR